MSELKITTTTTSSREVHMEIDAMLCDHVQALENALGVWLLNRITQRVEGAAGVPGAICTFSPFSRFTGGCKITWSPSLTPALTSTSVP